MLCSVTLQLKAQSQCSLILNGDLTSSQNTPSAGQTVFIMDAFTSGLVPSWYKWLVSPDIHLTLGTGVAPFHCARLASVIDGRSEAMAQDFATPLSMNQNYILSFQVRVLGNAPNNDLIVFLSDGTNNQTIFQNN